jgi:hypothetical protein
LLIYPDFIDFQRRAESLALLFPARQDTVMRGFPNAAKAAGNR